MSNENEGTRDTVEVSREEFESLLARVTKAERVESGEVTNPIVGITCNSCGKAVNRETGRCETHPSEFVNHIAVGRDPENGLRRPVIAKQTRAA